MKKVRIFIISLLLIISLSCNDEKFLEEEAIDFFAPENVFTSPEAFNIAIASLYKQLRFVTVGDNNFAQGLWATDANHSPGAPHYWHRGDWAAVTSEDYHANYYWSGLYDLIKRANVIITRAEAPEATWPDENEKKSIIAEARFFRGYAYRYLANGYGGVPILDKETTELKVDLVRATREDVYRFAKADLEYAVEWLPEEPKQDGRIDKYAAYHVLAVVHICLEEWNEAITAASKVIDNPRYKLMTERFGNFTGGVDIPLYGHIDGNVWWDLFRRGNQDRASGNTEALFILNLEFGVTGGDKDVWYAEYNFGPFYERAKDPDCLPGMVIHPNLGRPVWNSTPTNLLKYFLWEGNWDNDIRNAECNIMRTWIYNNPASAYYGDTLDYNNYCDLNDTAAALLGPYFTKNTSSIEGVPEGLATNSGQTWKDVYVMRLAETYLVRAEAHLGNNDKVSAAADINVVRSRANANPVDPNDVDIDYIFDERLRELYVEDWRHFEMMRLGILVDRVRKYNPYCAATVSDYHNLLPIPQPEIDRNVEAELTQNPGY